MEELKVKNQCNNFNEILNSNRWEDHGRPQGGDNSAIADTGALRPGIVFTIRYENVIVELNRNLFNLCYDRIGIISYPSKEFQAEFWLAALVETCTSSTRGRSHHGRNTFGVTLLSIKLLWRQQEGVLYMA